MAQKWKLEGGGFLAFFFFFKELQSKVEWYAVLQEKVFSGVGHTKVKANHSSFDSLYMPQ